MEILIRAYTVSYFLLVMMCFVSVLVLAAWSYIMQYPAQSKAFAFMLCVSTYNEANVSLYLIHIQRRHEFVKTPFVGTICLRERLYSIVKSISFFCKRNSLYVGYCEIGDYFSKISQIPSRILPSNISFHVHSRLHNMHAFSSAHYGMYKCECEQNTHDYRIISLFVSTPYRLLNKTRSATI